MFLSAFFLPLVVHSAQIQVGEPAPNVLLPFLDGNSAELADWLGRGPIYLKMWATWCSTCRQEMPHFEANFEQYGNEVAFFSINVGLNDTLGEVREFTKQYGLKMPSVIDISGQIGQVFGLKATPYHVLIDSDGMVVHAAYKASEQIDELLAKLTRRHAKVTAGKPARHRYAFPEKPGPREGDPAPPFSIRTLSGARFAAAGAAQARGPVYLLFFTTWCESYLAGEGDDPETASACEVTRRTIDAAFANSGSRPKLLGIASRLWTGPKELENYRKRFRPSYPLALDMSNEIFQSYGVRQFPTLILISNGRIQRRLSGAVTKLPAR